MFVAFSFFVFCFLFFLFLWQAHMQTKEQAEEVKRIRSRSRSLRENVKRSWKSSKMFGNIRAADGWVYDLSSLFGWQRKPKTCQGSDFIRLHHSSSAWASFSIRACGNQQFYEKQSTLRHNVMLHVLFLSVMRPSQTDQRDSDMTIKLMLTDTCEDHVVKCRWCRKLHQDMKSQRIFLFSQVVLCVLDFHLYLYMSNQVFTNSHIKKILLNH